MLVLLRRQWKLYPVTFTLTLASIALYIVTKCYWWYSWRLMAVAPFVHGVDLWSSQVSEIANTLGRLEGLPEGYVFEQFGALGIEQLSLIHI